MHIREMRRGDIPEVTTVFCDAFYNDELFSFIAPYRDHFPLAWRNYGLAKQHSAMVTPGYYGIVCVSDGQDGKGERDEVLGYAWWSRRVGKKEKNTDMYMQNNRSIGAAVERQLRHAETKYKSLFVPNQAECHISKGIFERALADNNVFGPIEEVAHWHLSVLAVSPKHQRKGVGKILVRWGVDEATRETLAAPDRPPVPATLTASATGRYLYASLGFRVVGWKSGILEEWGRAMLYDPAQHRKELREIYDKVMGGKEKGDGGGSCMLFDPKGYWIEEAPEGTLVNDKEVDAVWTTTALKQLKTENLEA